MPRSKLQRKGRQSKAEEEKDSVIQRQQEPLPDSSVLSKKTKSPAHSDILIEEVPKNSKSSLGSNNELTETERKKKSDPSSDLHSSANVQGTRSGCESSFNTIQSSLLKKLLVGESGYNTILNERVKCSKCQTPNILIYYDVTEMGSYLQKVLEEYENLKCENKALKLENATVTKSVGDLCHNLDVNSQEAVPGQNNLNSEVSPDAANLDSSNTFGMEAEGGTAIDTVMELDSSPCRPSNGWKQNSRKIKRPNNRKNESDSSFTSVRPRSSKSRTDGRMHLQERETTQIGNVPENAFKPEEVEDGAVGGSQLAVTGGPSDNSDWGTEVENQEWNESWDGLQLGVTGGPSDNSDWVTEVGNQGWNESRDGVHDGSQWNDKGMPKRGNPKGSGEKLHGGDLYRKDSTRHRDEHRGHNYRLNNGSRRERSAQAGKRDGDRDREKYKIVEEIQGDLFMAPKDNSLAHCVAEDMRMGSGIAVTFRQMFKNIDVLLQQHRKTGQVAILKNEERYIYYLVTKKVSTGKPRIDDLADSVQEMKQHCVQHGVKKIAMPRIGCGLDRLEWSKVKELLEKIFLDTDVHITVYNFQQDNVQEAPVPRSKLYVQQKLMSLVSIEKGTGLVFFGTEDSHVDKTMESLDSKYRFIYEYKMSKKKVGDVVRFEKLGECLYGLIVRKTAQDPFSYEVLNKCLYKLCGIIWHDKYQYFGMEAFIVENDDVTMEKIITLLKAVFFNKRLEAWICWPQDLEEIYYHYNSSRAIGT